MEEIENEFDLTVFMESIEYALDQFDYPFNRHDEL